MQIPLEEKTVELHNGKRSAIATLHRLENGWVIDVIAEEGCADLAECDTVFTSFEQASRSAQAAWIR